MRFRSTALVAASFFCVVAPANADTAGVVRGTVTIGGSPASGATVDVRGEGTTLHTVTTADGRFTFAHVGFGRYTLTAHRAGSADIAQPIDVSSGAVVDVALDLAIKQIGRTQTGLTKGPSASPVSVNAIGREALATLPQNQSLNAVIETLPGVVRFSYDEPVAHGFHGLTYEIDGVPLPVGTTSNFSEIIDPRTIDSLEVFTGAFPAEFGGTRQGAVANIISHRANDLTAPEEGSFTAGIGNYGDAQTSLSDSATLGRTRVFINANEERTNRGIDSPTFDPIHDRSNQSNQFLRTITNLSARDTLAFDASNNDATFQIPTNSTFTANDPIVVPGGSGDVQHEYDTFFNAVFTHNAKSGTAYTQLAPWYRHDRIAYDGDVASDLTGGVDGLQQDRRSSFAGLRLTQFVTAGAHALKAGVDESIENFSGSEHISYLGTDAAGNPTGGVLGFDDASAKRGSQFGAYVEDKWTPTKYVSLQGGLRVDRSTGYVSGGQLSPRIEFNGQVDPHDIVHAYYGTLYAAPFVEDTRRAAVLLGGGTGGLPTYDLQPEHDAYVEVGIAHTFAPGARATVNAWKRDVRDVLDTTQLANTPIFAVYNNTIGIAKGVETRIDLSGRNGDAFFLSAQLSSSRAGGISGSTFLFPPTSSLTDVTLQPEDHDQTFSADLGYTKHFGRAHALFASLEPIYGTGYPVQFQNGATRLAPHLTFDASFGREAGRGAVKTLGFTATFTNFTNTAYLLKVNNGFNTTQWGEGFRTDLRLTAPF